MKPLRCLALLVLALLTQLTVAAQTPVKLTLKEAEETAVKNHPQVSAAQFNSLAAEQVPTEIQSVRYPNFFASVTGVGSGENTRIGAGALSNSNILSRGATGVTVTQLITDFGRVDRIVESSRLHARAVEENEQATRAQIIFQVDRAYYSALRAQAVLKVAEQTVASRQLVVEQTEALRQSGIKSGLDVSFTNYNLAEAKLLLAKAQNEVKAAFADLSIALGNQEEQVFDLAEEPLPPVLDQNDLVPEALRKRPEIVSLQFDRDSAFRFASAEKKLKFPTISAIWTAGVIPFGDGRLNNHYDAVGLNISIPIFNGRLFKAREAEADYRAKAVEQNLKDLENRVARDVRVARLNVDTAYQRLGLTAQLLSKARESLDLAQERYRLGLSSIVELNQAQLNVTVAEIESASAKYEYLIQRALLNYQTASQP